MAAANASPRAQRRAIMESTLVEMSGFYLAVDCLPPGCRGERTFAVAELPTFYGKDLTIGVLLRRLRCQDGCGGHVGAAWLDTGPISNLRYRLRRTALLGPEVRE